MKTQNKRKITKAIILARVATTTQVNPNNSIESQIKRIEEYCKKEGFTVSRKISGVYSGHKTGMLSRLLEIIKGYKNKVIVCCDKIDRLSRDTTSKELNNLKELASQGKIELHFVSDNQIIKSSVNAGDDFAFNMKKMLSRHHSDTISNNVKRALEQKRHNGEWANKAPFGYINTTDSNGKKTLIIDQDKAPLIRDIFNLYRTKILSLNDILKALRIIYPNNAFETKKGLDRTLIYRIIKNEDFYSGHFSHKGKKYQHKYESVLSLINPK